MAQVNTNGFCEQPFTGLQSVRRKELTILVQAMHILTAGPRTRRSQAGNHGASGVEKPQKTTVRGVAPGRKVGSLDRQVPRGYASKVRSRSGCRACHSILRVERQLQARVEDSFGVSGPTARWLSFLVLCSLLRLPESAHKKPPSREPQVTKQAAQFPARSTCLGAKNRRARLPSA